MQQKFGGLATFACEVLTGGGMSRATRLRRRTNALTDARNRSSELGRVPMARSRLETESQTDERAPLSRNRSTIPARRLLLHSRLRAPRTQAALGLARLDGDPFRRRDRKLGPGKDVEGAGRLPGQFAVFANPAGHHGLGQLFDPFFEQSRDLLTQIGGVIQARELEAFKRRDRSLVQEIPGWDPMTGHFLSPGEG
jgi:hypothetical protein